jgi:phosphoribosylaminoimidazole carboxylase
MQLGGSSSPAGQLSHLSIEGSFQDRAKIFELSSISDVLTTEIEHVNADALEELEKKGFEVHPNSATIRLIQDKYLQKVHLASQGLQHKPKVPLGEYISTASLEAAREAGIKFGFPFMLKSRKFAYDGKGNALVKSPSELEAAFNSLCLLNKNNVGTGMNTGTDTDIIFAEKFVPFVKELSVVAVRTGESAVQCFPVAETIQKENVCQLVICPAMVSSLAAGNALEAASRAVAAFSGRGVYGVELFLLADDTVLVNEIAPRSLFPFPAY